MQPQKMGFREYVEALEEERLKIQVFSKELPLSLELVSQAIDAYRQQLSGSTEYNVVLHGQSDCSEQTSMEEGPVLEEFIPIKKRDSPDCDEDDDEEEEDEDEQHSHKHKILKENNNNNNSDKRKSDWLRSVQLWNPDPETKEDLPRKAMVVEVKRNGNGGAFQPFHREENNNNNNNFGKTNNNSNSNNSMPAVKSVSPAPVPAMSSTAGGGSKRSEEKEGQGSRKQRRCWSPELHKRFLQALQQLGGPDSATPKQIREHMKVDGLTNDEVKSHLQKFRLHTRRPNAPMIHNNATSQTAPFVLVGNIFMQPPEYAAAVATSTASGEVTTVTTPTGIYAPVAAHPPMPVQPKKAAAQVKQLVQSHSMDEERGNHGSEGAVHSNSSPDSSSSTHTTSHSHGY